MVIIDLTLPLTLLSGGLVHNAKDYEHYDTELVTLYSSVCSIEVLQVEGSYILHPEVEGRMARFISSILSNIIHKEDYSDEFPHLTSIIHLYSEAIDLTILRQLKSFGLDVTVNDVTYEVLPYEGAYLVRFSAVVETP